MNDSMHGVVYPLMNETLVLGKFMIILNMNDVVFIVYILCHTN